MGGIDNPAVQWLASHLEQCPELTEDFIRNAPEPRLQRMVIAVAAAMMEMEHAG